VPEVDLPARWHSEEWLAALEAWLVPALHAAGVGTTGPVVRDRVRFWSVVARVETDAGRVWVKENAPSQAFEAALVTLVDRLVPDAVATPLAVDRHRGWLATADLGLPMWHDEQVPPLADWVAVLQGYGAVQHVLADHAEAVLATGIPTFPEQPDDVVGWVEHLVEASRALPDADPRRLDDAELTAVVEGLPLLRDAAERLAASGIPPSVQHNDLHLGNAFRRPSGSIAFIDLGDALWTHPLTSARIPLWIMHNRLELSPEGPQLQRAVDAYLEPWTDRWDRATLRGLLADAERISCLHRAESWRRLQADVPVTRVDEPFLRSVPEWLVDAAAPDPYASAVAR
jgi:Phosphotransferase enzyme family